MTNRQAVRGSLTILLHVCRPQCCFIARPELCVYELSHRRPAYLLRNGKSRSDYGQPNLHCIISRTQYLRAVDSDQRRDSNRQLRREGNRGADRRTHQTIYRHPTARAGIADLPHHRSCIRLRPLQHLRRNPSRSQCHSAKGRLL